MTRCDESNVACDPGGIGCPPTGLRGAGTVLISLCRVPVALRRPGLSARLRATGGPAEVIVTETQRASVSIDMHPLRTPATAGFEGRYIP